jgi:flagellar M-ring protein FliF
MPDFISNFFDQLKTFWSKWSMVQRAMVIGIAAAAVVAVIVLFSVSSSPGLVPLIDMPITNEDDRTSIVTRINQEGVRVQVNAAGIIQVSDEETARRMRMMLLREDLLPKGTDPWALFDKERWSITDLERNVNLQRALKQTIIDHIKSLSDIDDAKVEIVQPPKELFAAEQNPTTASVTLFPKPGVELSAERKKIEGIQKLLSFSVPGLKTENIIITDQYGNQLNDFAGMADIDRLEITKRELKLVSSLEQEYRGKVLRALQAQFSDDRVRDLNIKIEMDQSKKNVQSSIYKPIMIKEQTPGLPYDDSERVASLTLSESTSTTKWEGTGMNPEGPAGVEGQTPPAYKDMSNLYGKVSQETRTHNEVFNEEKIQEERSPSIERVSVSVNIDGKWGNKIDEEGKVVKLPDGRPERLYTPVSGEDLAKATTLVQGAVGYSAARGDVVNVTNIEIDRSAQFAAEDAQFYKERNIRITIIAALIGIALLFAGFIIFQVVQRAQEQARRRREEELARQHQLMREQALLDAEKEGSEVSMSVEDQARMELQEKAIQLAREHPADVSQLIRTWLMEE